MRYGRRSGRRGWGDFCGAVTGPELGGASCRGPLSGRLMPAVIKVEAMGRTEIIDKLKAVEPELRAHGVSALYLFGAHARGEGREDSDIDVFVNKTPGRRFGLDAFMCAYRVLQNAFPGKEIGYTAREGLVDCYRPSASSDAGSTSRSNRGVHDVDRKGDCGRLVRRGADAHARRRMGVR